jgi:hypothetical protein
MGRDACLDHDGSGSAVKLGRAHFPLGPGGAAQCSRADQLSADAKLLLPHRQAIEAPLASLIECSESLQ